MPFKRNKVLYAPVYCILYIYRIVPVHCIYQESTVLPNQLRRISVQHLAKIPWHSLTVSQWIPTKNICSVWHTIYTKSFMQWWHWGGLCESREACHQVQVLLPERTVPRMIYSGRRCKCLGEMVCLLHYKTPSMIDGHLMLGNWEERMPSVCLYRYVWHRYADHTCIGTFTQCYPTFIIRSEEQQ
jgi:hypothetical protein